MRTVLVYRSVLLPYSEVFIRSQLAAYGAWRAILVGRQLVHELPLDGLELRLLGPRPTSATARLFAKIRYAVGWPEGAGVLRYERPDLLHAHFGPDAVEAAPLARCLGLPMVITLHGFDVMTDRGWWERGHRGLSMRNYPRALLRLAQSPDVRFVAVSRAAQSAAVAFGIPREKVDVHYIGIDTDKFRPGATPIEARQPRVIFVGRLVEKKGCEYLVRAMPIVAAQVPDAELLIVGDGPLRPQLAALARELNVKVRFVGARTQDELIEDLDQARVLCLPSVRARNGDAEGFGLVLLEAQASGVPVVSSAIGGAEEGLLDGLTGFRFPERDTAALATRLINVLNDDILARRLANEAPRFVKRHFDIRRCTRELENFYDSLVVPPGEAVAGRAVVPNGL